MTGDAVVSTPGTTGRTGLMGGAAERALVQRMLTAAPRGLAESYLPATGEFVQTVRGVTSPEGVVLAPEGRNLRYASMAALGLSRVEESLQRSTLAGRTAGEVVDLAVERALSDADPGAVALAAWAQAEVNGEYAGPLFARLREMLTSGEPLPTVDVSWMLTAAVVAEPLGEVAEVVSLVADRLLAAQGARGIFPHWLPASSQPRWRAHVGCFADQVYPIQALARASVLTGERRQLEAANATARRICELQGSHGQWWWHYDIRDGEVVEGFPVYSVHQHAMAPMVLFDLRDAGGEDHLDSIAAGVRWLESHPEVVEELVAERWGLVWRKVGRREPPKAARALGALTTAVRPGLHLPGLERSMPPVKVDYECRPYELGWLLYAWLSQAPAPRG